MYRLAATKQAGPSVRQGLRPAGAGCRQAPKAVVLGTTKYIDAAVGRYTPKVRRSATRTLRGCSRSSLQPRRAVRADAPLRPLRDPNAAGGSTPAATDFPQGRCGGEDSAQRQPARPGSARYRCPSSVSTDTVRPLSSMRQREIARAVARTAGPYPGFGEPVPDATTDNAATTSPPSRTGAATVLTCQGRLWWPTA